MDDLQISPDDRRYSDAAACVRIYWAQATELNLRDQKIMIEYIKDHLDSLKSAGIPVEQHMFYFATMRLREILGKHGLEWIIFLILSAVYPKLPEDYVNSIEELYGSSKIEDHSDKYFKKLGLKKKEQLSSIAITKSNPSIQAKLSTPSSSTKRRQISPCLANKASTSTETEPHPPMHSCCSAELSQFRMAFELTNKNLDTLRTKLDAIQAKVDGAPSRLKAAMDNPFCHDDDEEE
ncbi:hypothetical protein THARTR1_03945 [Trichoderma harzianum]|uniref:Uncharacterized protein n=1 Tax=Trichoderma harzianum TaxID=5544 RepID=A0A2K0UE06_TRIHA|nr:hypothetical protein THARTR1_03945 [Trichoderma harzianum]